MAGIVIFRSFQVLFVSGLPGEVPAYSLVHTLFFLFTPALSAVRFRFCYWGRDCAKEAPFCMACVPSSIACAITDRRFLFLPADPGMSFSDGSCAGGVRSRPGFSLLGCGRVFAPVFWHFPPFLISVIRLFGFRVFLYTSRSLRTYLLCLHAGVPDPYGLHFSGASCVSPPPAKCSVFKGITSSLDGHHGVFLILVHGNPLLFNQQETAFPDVRALQI